ncbi:MAG: dihydrodipicolinate synthase/N-acetylneuraminate lyase [Myxococcota bacterium]
MRLYVALLTPFDSRGKPDLPRLRAHILWLTSQGVDGFVATGSTGEFPYLSAREREAIHRTAIDAAGGRPVYACTWDPSITTVAYLTDAAAEQGAAGILAPPPLYYDVGDDLLERWFREVSERASIPVLAYHNPSRFPTPIRTKLYAKLRSDNVLAGMKDSSMDLFRLSRLAAADPNAIFAGGDRVLAQVTRIPRIAGFVSAISNVWPEFCVRILKRREGQLEEALVSRVNQLRRAGGVRALKGLLRMGCRAPLYAPERAELEGLPPPERPV